MEDDAKAGEPPGPSFAKEERAGPDPPLFEAFDLADFEASGVNVATADLRRFDRYAMCGRIGEALQRAEASRDAAATRVFGTLQTIMTMHMRVEPEGDAFGVRWMDSSRRTALPGDFAGEQAKVLAAIAARISHPTLRARVADVAYEAGERRAGLIAVEAYCAIADRIIDGTAKMEFRTSAPGRWTRSSRWRGRPWSAPGWPGAANWRIRSEPP